MEKEMYRGRTEQAMKLEFHQTPCNPVMKVLIIYDNFAFATRAAELLQRAAHQVDAVMHWNLKLWRLDTLRLPHRGDEALAEAADARLIVFAGHRTQSLPSWLLDWMERWVASRQTADSAFAVVGGRNGDELALPSARELSLFAERHGISFAVDDGLVARCEAELSRNKIAVETFTFEKFELPVTKRATRTGQLNSVSESKGAETVSKYEGLPLPAKLNKLKHMPVPYRQTEAPKACSPPLASACLLHFLL
jgi:hypothetical protein